MMAGRQDGLDGGIPGWSSMFNGRVLGLAMATNPTDTDVSVADTVSKMAEHVNSSVGSRELWNAVKRAGVSKDDSDTVAIDKCYRWIKANVKFVRDEPQLAKMFSDGGRSRELLIHPRVLLGMNQPQGDCDDFSMLCLAMLGTLGINGSFVTSAVEADMPEQFTHVYCNANGIPLDCSHGKQVGWEAPSYRKQLWPVYIWNEGENGMIQGLGDDGTEPIDFSYIDLYGDTQWVPPPISTGRTNTSWLENLISGAAVTGEQVIKNVTQKPGIQTTTRGPNGQLQTTSVVAQPGQAVSSFNLPGFSTAGGISPLVIGGVALVGLLFYLKSR